MLAEHEISQQGSSGIKLLLSANYQSVNKLKQFTRLIFSTATTIFL